MDPKAEITIKDRQDEQKEMLLKYLKEAPIVMYACIKAGIGDSTYYRWRAENPEFARLADQALKEGRSHINDLAESKVITGIKEGNKTFIIYWLNNNHPRYSKNYKTEQKTNDIKENKVTIVSWADGQLVKDK